MFSHLCRGFQHETYTGISLYHTLCCGFHHETYTGISPYHTLYCGFNYETYTGISPYHTLCCGFNYETYIGIILYHTQCCGFHFLYIRLYQENNLLSQQFIVIYVKQQYLITPIMNSYCCLSLSCRILFCHRVLAYWPPWKDKQQ